MSMVTETHESPTPFQTRQEEARPAGGTERARGQWDTWSQREAGARLKA